MTLHTSSRALAAAFLLCAAATGSRAQTITVDATSVIRTVDDKMFGINTPFWDGTFTSATTAGYLAQIKPGIMRFGGGSDTDQYVWSTNSDNVGNFKWAFSIDDFAAVAKAAGSQGLITTNYGSAQASDAAAYVQYANITKGYGFKYWEVGNEDYGFWEHDLNTPTHDGYTYATRAVQYIQAMKAVDPTIKVGAVIPLGEDSYVNGNTLHPATNPRTNVAHNGFGPVMLATFKSLGVYPDYLIYHRYEQNPGQENDAFLLQAALTWPQDAASLRQEVTDYLGASVGAGIEFLVTENNSVSSAPGKQSVSLVNGLYMADSTANLMQTEFNSLIWWDLHNGLGYNSATNQINLSSSLYGWRMYGDYGLQDQQPPPPATSTVYPTFYVSKLLTHYARGGDSVLKTTSTANLLSAYSVKRVDGTLSILVINKSPTATYTANFSLTGFSPQPNATVYTYGMTQDNNAQSGTGSPDIATSTISNAGATFSAAFTPYSVTVLSLSPSIASPTVTVQPSSQTVASGHTVVFSFQATGSPAPTYQWYLNGSAISGATGATLVVNGATSANAGTYTAVATNSSGAATSNPATLTVATTSDPGRLINLSARAQVGTGANIIFGGFAIGPLSLSGTLPVLIRGSGPAIAAAPFNVPGTLPDPKLQLFDSTGAVLQTNTGWAGDATIASTASAVGAFAWGSKTSHDAALLTSLPVSSFTAQLSGQTGDTGDALVEVYDATPAGTYTASKPRLTNLSARVDVGTGPNALFAGFVIGGSTSVTVLIRASGPAIAAAPFDVPGTLPDPVLTLRDVNLNVLETNSGWGGDATIASTAASVGAFSWSTPGSADSALLVTLAPGAYTAEASGASSDSGVAIVEVYEVQ